MNKEQYTQYVAAVENFLKSNNVKPGCFSLKDPDSEGFFSWQECDCCERKQGGTRYTYHFATTNHIDFDADICDDCVYFLAYGKLDDLTMLEIEESEKPHGV